MQKINGGFMTFWDAGTTDANGNLINYHYQIAQFSDGTQTYQEIDANGNVTRFTDMNGNTLKDLPTTQYFIYDSLPQRPNWGT